MKYLHLCLHTLRADCNGLSIVRMKLKCTFASTRSVQIATVKSIGNRLHTIFASTRSVQIATNRDLLHQRQIVKDFLIKFTKIYKKGARSTIWLLTPRLIDYIFPFSRSLQRYA